MFCRHRPSISILRKAGQEMDVGCDTHELLGDFGETGKELIQFLERLRLVTGRSVLGRQTHLLSFAQFATTREVCTEQSHHAIDNQQLVRAIINETGAKW